MYVIASRKWRKKVFVYFFFTSYLKISDLIDSKSNRSQHKNLLSSQILYHNGHFTLLNLERYQVMST